MGEELNDGFYWEPDRDAPLRQGDILLNVPSVLLPSRPEFVLRPVGAQRADIESYDRFPEIAPTTAIIAEARWGALAMIVTPTCHISEGEKDEDIVAIVPVEPLGIVVETNDARDDLRRGAGSYHLFYLPSATIDGGNLMPWDGVAQLDRPSSLLKHQLRDYRKLGLHVDARFKLREKLAWFWARASATQSLDKMREGILTSGRPLHELE